MKKKVLAGLILGMLSITSAYSAEGTSTLLEQLRAEKVEEFKNNIDAISARVNNYILNTADITVTRKELQVFDTLPYYFFNNFEGISCTNSGTYCNPQTGTDGIQISVLAKTLEFSNVLGSTPNNYVVEAFTSSSDNSRVITSALNYTVQIPLDTLTSNFISLIGKISVIPEAYIGLTAPSDITKTWYLANGTGGFDIRKYSTSLGKWIDIGSTGTNGQSSVQAKSEDELFAIPCLKNDKGLVIENDIAIEYVCTTEGDWVSLNTGVSEFNGEAQMLALVTTLMKKTGGSIANVTDPNQTGVLISYSGIKDFTKKDSSLTNGYWIDSTNTYIATDSYTTLSAINAADGSFGFLPDVTKTKVLTLKRMSNTWLYLADGYRDVVSNFDFVPTGKAYIMDMRNATQLFERVGVYYLSHSNVITRDNKLMMSDNDRSAMPSSASIEKYLLVAHDCTSSTCNAINAPYYAGQLTDEMYTFYYAVGGKRENNLVDATPATSLADIYNRNLSAALYDNVVYLKDTDSLGRVCYKNTSGIYYTKGGSAIPTGNNLPFAKTCETASYSGNYLILDNRTQATEWTTAPHEAGVNINGATYTHVAVSSKDFWTTSSVGDGQVSATEIFTGGTRTSFPNVTHTLNALTKNVDTPNYTSVGVVSSIDNSFKQWFYSSSGTRVNSLLDGIPTTNAYLDNNAINVGFAIQSGIILQKCENHWCKIGTSQVVNSSLANNNIATVVAIGATQTGTDCDSIFTTWNNNSGNNVRMGTCTKASNGLWYDNCTLGTYPTGNSYCASKGMRLPTHLEATAWNSSGVPSCTQWTWTSTYDGLFYLWLNSSIARNNGYSNLSARCVK